MKNTSSKSAPATESTAGNTTGSGENKPEVPPERLPAAKPRQIKYEFHEVIVIKTGPTMGLHIKKNEQTGEIYVSNKVPGSDAEQSNVKANDILVSINGIELKNESIYECANLMSNSKEYVDFKLKRVAENKESP